MVSNILDFRENNFIEKYSTISLRMCAEMYIAELFLKD